MHQTTKGRGCSGSAIVVQDRDIVGYTEAAGGEVPGVLPSSRLIIRRHPTDPGWQRHGMQQPA